MRKSNYDKQPSTHIDGKAVIGWDNIIQTLSKAWADEPVWTIDLYPGTYEEDFIEAFAKTGRKSSTHAPLCGRKRKSASSQSAS